MHSCTGHTALPNKQFCREVERRGDDRPYSNQSNVERARERQTKSRNSSVFIHISKGKMQPTQGVAGKRRFNNSRGKTGSQQQRCGLCDAIQAHLCPSHRLQMGLISRMKWIAAVLLLLLVSCVSAHRDPAKWLHHSLKTVHKVKRSAGLQYLLRGCAHIKSVSLDTPTMAPAS